MGISTIKWIFGKIGTGKTSYATFHGRKNGSTPLFIGKECRKKFGAGKMAKTVNPTAPAMSEKFVRELVIQAISGLNFGNTLYIDGVPRKPSQVRWIKENFNTPDFRHEFVLFTCDDNIRQLRLRKRDEGNLEDLELTKARLHEESHNILRVVEEIIVLKHFFNQAELTVYDNTDDDPLFKYEVHENRKNMSDTYDTDEVEAVKFTDYNIGRMFSSIQRFANSDLQKFGVSLGDIYRTTYMVNECHVSKLGVDWARRFITAARDELNEALKEIPDRWWSSCNVDLRATRVEIIDAWHFIISASEALGMGYDLFTRTFWDKFHINEQRQISGKKTGDDKDIGKSRR